MGGRDEDSNHSDKYKVKVYAVIRKHNLTPNGEANREILAVKLTHQAAQSFVDQHVGSCIEKHVADKDFY